MRVYECMCALAYKSEGMCVCVRKRICVYVCICVVCSRIYVYVCFGL